MSEIANELRVLLNQLPPAFLLFLCLAADGDVNDVVHQIVAIFRYDPSSANGTDASVLLPLFDAVLAERVHAVQRRGLQDKWQFINL